MGTADIIRLGPLHQVALRADDLEQSIHFYRDRLGVSFIASFDPPGLAFFDLAGVRLLLDAGASSGALYFKVDDIQQAFQTLQERGVHILSPPHLIAKMGSYDLWMTFFKDSEDNVLSLMSEVPPA